MQPLKTENLHHTQSTQMGSTCRMGSQHSPGRRPKMYYSLSAKLHRMPEYGTPANMIPLSHQTGQQPWTGTDVPTEANITFAWAFPTKRSKRHWRSSSSGFSSSSIISRSYLGIHIGGRHNLTSNPRGIPSDQWAGYGRGIFPKSPSE